MANMPDSSHTLLFYRCAPMSHKVCIMPTQLQMNRIIEEQGAVHWARFCEQHDTAQLMSHQDEIVAAFGRSEFIARQCLAHPEWLYEILTRQPATDIDHAAQLTHLLKDITSEEAMQKAIRMYRNQHMLRLAWYDLHNRQTIEISLAATSELADALIYFTYQWIYDSLCKRYGTPDGPYGPQPMLILAMGKLGGMELNFSSDIDLIFCYPYKGETQGGKKSLEHQQFFNKVAQKLIAALDKVTVDGQVFRVDMRLRPFGDSGPLVSHFSAFEDYYQEQGRSWERFAMIKARPVNPRGDYNDELLQILRPFTFRRYLDFTTIDALRHMKGLINREIRRRGLRNNIKLGPGGIREVEFFAQSFQLIHGGREPLLRQRGLRQTLEALDELNIVESDTIEMIYQNYLFLRKLEHTLQQLNDEQTQTLPDDENDKAVVAAVMGFEDYDSLITELNHKMSAIHAQFNDLVEEHHQAHDETDTLFSICQDAWQVDLSADEFINLFKDYLDKTESEQVFKRLTDFRTKLRQFRLGERGGSTLDGLMPELLHTLVEAHPDRIEQVMRRVLSVIKAITGRTTYLNLLLENLNVLKQLVKLCERSEWIAIQIKRFPLLLDELLTPLYLEQQNTSSADSLREYQDELRQLLLRVDPDDVELTMDICRQFKLCQQLRIAASDINGSLPINKVSDKLTMLAEAILNSVIRYAWQQVALRYGQPEHLDDNNLGFAVVGYGKLGGYELGYGSDLDLVFLHNAPRDAQTNGKRQVSAQQFYIKLAQRIMHFLNTTTLFGQLYETDLRLRPSGSAGLLCCHIDGFETYQRDEAWTWEHQALVRARGVAGDAGLLSHFDVVRQQILTQQRPLPSLISDVTSMREKMRTHLEHQREEGVDLKQCAGGITDVEFVTQYLVLGYSHRFERLISHTDNLSILDTARDHGVISADVCEQLQQAYLKLRDHYHQLTLADDKYAKSTDSLDELRHWVRSAWQKILSI